MPTKITGTEGVDQVKDGTIVADDLAAAAVTSPKLSLNTAAAALGADVALNNSANYFDGPSLTLGAGIWLVVATVTVSDTVATAFYFKLWDGTTVSSSAAGENGGAGFRLPVTLSAVVTNPVGAVKVSVRSPSTTTGTIRFNVSANSKDTHITAVRIG